MILWFREGLPGVSGGKGWEQKILLVLTQEVVWKKRRKR